MSKTNNKKKSFGLALTLAILFFIPAICILVLYSYFIYDLPRIESLKDYRPNIVTKVYSSSGDVIGEFFIEKRYPVRLSDVSTTLIEAIIAAEDDQFFKHKGINIWSILRAALKNISSFEIKQGGSTITQQILKSLLLTPEKSFSRKIKEAILATKIEKYLSKDDILTIYLNEIYFGHGAYGIEAASRAYFGKSSHELSTAEASMLAGLPKAPSYYSPLRNLERAKQRQSYVLSRMVMQGYLTPEKKEEAENDPLNFIDSENINTSMVPYFVEHIRRAVKKKYGSDYLYKGGLSIETTLDLNMQNIAQKAVATGVSAYEKRHGVSDNNSRVQAALVSMDPFSGHIKAMVGGRDFNKSQFNRAVQAWRQPGSAFKPIIYAAALDKGFTPSSIIIDSPFVLEERMRYGYRFWEPQNYDRIFSGPITLRKALTQSRNIVTIKILQNIGVDYVIKYAGQLGVEGEFKHNLSLALGTCSVTLLNMVKAFSTFCAQGVYADPIFISRITDRDGNVIEENRPRLTPSISPQTAYIMTTLLQSVVEEGTGRKVRALSRPCAGKTGTTNDVRDAWFIGYAPQIVTGVWVGFDDLKPLGKHETGAVAASPVWLDFMQNVLKNEPIQNFKVPDGIVFVKINPETGYYPVTKNEKTIFECFKEGTLPTSYIQTNMEEHNSID
jgi:penicillin-binding protein 1A